MKKYYAYTRVSTQRQGEKGVSLQEQHAAIVRYAENHNLQIAEWFEERVTAAKSGRPIWSKMVNGLHDGKAQGVVIHKIDRSARNLRDWSDLGDLIDAGVAVHFANESIDLQSRGGRLSADIQAVVASDYIRNLREECIKGMYGRLKQGIYPWGAPVGYLDMGGGKVKEIDPVSQPGTSPRTPRRNARTGLCGRAELQNGKHATKARIDHSAKFEPFGAREIRSC